MVVKQNFAVNGKFIQVEVLDLLLWIENHISFCPKELEKFGLRYKIINLESLKLKD
jgi:hypothetical protein